MDYRFRKVCIFGFACSSLAQWHKWIAPASTELVERILKITHSNSVGGEHIGSYSDEGANTRLAMHLARIACY